MHLYIIFAHVYKLIIYLFSYCVYTSMYLDPLSCRERERGGGGGNPQSTLGTDGPAMCACVEEKGTVTYMYTDNAYLFLYKDYLP